MENSEPLYEYQAEETRKRRLIRKLRLYADTLNDNQWILPVAGCAMGLLLAILVGRLEFQFNAEPSTITVVEARGGLISALSILFAGLSIVLALASVTTQNVVSRLSLRMLRIYLRNPWDKAVIAMFAMAATFIFAVWFQLRSLAPNEPAPAGGIFMGMFLILLTGAMMIWYISILPGWFQIHHTAKRVRRLILNAARSFDKDHHDEPRPEPTSFDRPTDAMTLYAPRSGFLMDVDAQGLMDLAVRYDTKYVIDSCIERRVVRGEPIGWMVGGGESKVEAIAREHAADTLEITELQELDRAVGYGLIVLADIAVMSLSSAVNDPNTAVQVLEELALLLPELAHYRLGSFGRIDGGGVERVAVMARSFGDYVDLATKQILLNAGDDPAVLDALGHLARILEGMELEKADLEAVENFASKVQNLGL